MRQTGRFVLLLAGAACAGQWIACGGGTAPARSAAEPRAVQVAAARIEPLERSIPVTGTLGAQQHSVLGAKVPGRVQRFAVDVGSRVRRGDLLVQIEPADYELRERQAAAALGQARAAVGLPVDGDDDHVELESLSAVREARTLFEQAARNRKRADDLTKSGILSQSDLDAVGSADDVARTRYDRALEETRTRVATVAQRRAELDLARKQLADTAVRAPFDGAVEARLGNVGEYVAAGAPLVSVVQADPLRLRLDVPEREASSVRIGQAVRLLVEGDDQPHTGRIARVSPALDETSRSLRIEADVPAAGSLRPGLFARAQIILNDADDALCVPPEALVTFAGIEKVVVAENGVAQERTVTTGRRAPGCVEIVAGMKAGEPVVLAPGGIRTGQPLTIARSDAAPAAPAAADGTAASR